MNFQLLDAASVTSTKLVLGPSGIKPHNLVAVPSFDRLFFTCGVTDRKIYLTSLSGEHTNATLFAEMPLSKGLYDILFHPFEQCLFAAAGKAIWRVTLEGTVITPPIFCPDPPRRLTVDPLSGDIYFTTYVSIYKLTPTDNQIEFFAGVPSDEFGHRDGPGEQSRFNFPQGLAFSPTDKSLIVADTGNNCIRRITLKDRFVTTIAGNPGSEGRGCRDGKALAEARFNSPDSVAIDSFGRIFVSDTDNDRIRRISPEGVVSTISKVYSPRGFTYNPTSQTFLVAGTTGINQINAGRTNQTLFSR